MVHLKSYLLAIFMVAVCAAAVHSQVPDSLLKEKHLKSLVVDNPDSLLRLLDVAEARRLPTMPQYRIDLLRAMAYNELRMFSLKERYAMKVLDDDSIAAHPDLRLNAMVMALSAQSFYGNYRASLPLAMEAIKLARQLGNRPGEYNILQTVAADAFEFGDRKQGYEYLEQVISSGYGSDKVRDLANVSSALGMKVIQLYADDRYREALAESRRRMEVISRIDSLGGAPAGFTDQQRAYTYARMASSACQLGDRRLADDAYRRFMSTEYASTDYGRAYIVDYLLESCQYGKVLEFTHPLYGILQMERAVAVKDSLIRRENQSHAQELATMFEVEEKELALSQSREESARRLTWLVVSIGIVAVVSVALAALWWHYRMVLKRNRLAARQIDELMAQRSIMRGNEAEPDGKSADKEKFMDMESRIIQQLLFLEQGCNRDMIADRCSMPKAAVSQLIQQYARCSVGEYVNRLKVEHSVELIRQHPDWTIEAIGYASGFNSRSTYYQHFNRIFGITPAQYASQQPKK